MLISDDYRELNKQLHKDNSAYGTSGINWAGIVFYMRKGRGENPTVLDYGCGKGFLGDVYNRPEWFHEYDPAIEGKDKLPEGMFDIVVCTDVLEHIEPEHLDDVLAHIESLTKQTALFYVATKPAVKTLADGRNAHISLHDADWWHDKLREKFAIQDFQPRGGHVYVLCEKIIQIPQELPTKSAVTVDIRYEQAKANISKVEKRVFPHAGFAYPTERPVIIACFGPSLKDTWEEIRVQKEMGAMLVTVSGAHDFLIERGIVPDIHIEADPRAHKAFFTSTPHRDVKYWIASCCHTSVIDQLKDYDIALWHVLNNREWDMKILDIPSESDQPVVGGKGTVGMRAMSLLFAWGYRRFLIHGMDASFDLEGNRHAGEHSGKVQKAQEVRVGNRSFLSNLGMVVTARSLIGLKDELNECARDILGEEPKYDGLCIEIILHGDGLQQELVRQGNGPVEVVEEAAA